jgi:hypothetical protein
VKLVAKYFEYKRKELIPVALMMNFHHQWSAAINFVAFILFDIILNPPLYMLFAILPVLFSVSAWIYTFSHLVAPHLKKKLLLINGMIALMNLIMLFTLLNLDYTLVGTATKFDTQTNPLMLFIMILTIEPIFAGSMFIFLRHGLKSRDPKIQWMGKVIFLYHISFFIATMLDGLTLSPIFLILARFLLIFSSIVNYFGWFMPKRVEKWLIKAEPDIISDSLEEEDDVQDFLKVVANRRRISEEEVTVFREKKICLVCKGKILGFTFICECDALYCEKCARALSQLDNFCWACERPIDKSLPVKEQKKEVERDEIVTSEKEQKYGKKIPK